MNQDQLNAIVSHFDSTGKTVWITVNDWETFALIDLPIFKHSPGAWVLIKRLWVAELAFEIEFRYYGNEEQSKQYLGQWKKQRGEWREVYT